MAKNCPNCCPLAGAFFPGTQVGFSDICWALAGQLNTRRLTPDLQRRGHPGTHSDLHASKMTVAGGTGSATGCSAVALAIHARQRASGQRRRGCITCIYIRRYVGTPWCKAFTVDSTHQSNRCIERPQEIFVEEDADAAAVARGGAEVSTTQGQQASASSGAAPQVVSSAAGEMTASGTTVGDGTSARQTDPWKTWKVRKSFASHSQSHHPRRTW